MNQDLLEISDGKLYGNNDMGQSIWLDPYDVFTTYP